MPEDGNVRILMSYNVQHLHLSYINQIKSDSMGVITSRYDTQVFNVNIMRDRP
jgi:hypothetical protein